MNNRTALVVSMLLLSSCAKPLLEGGFEGSYDCGGDDLGATAVFDQEKDGDLSGALFTEIELLLLGKQYTRFEIDNGKYDDKTGEYEFTLVDADNNDRYSAEVQLDEETGNQLTGKLTEVRTDNNTPASCDIDMDRVAVSANN